MMRFVCILLLCLVPLQSVAQPASSPSEIWVGEYRLQFKELRARSRIRIADTLLCLDEYDYVYLEGYIEEDTLRCAARVARAKADRDSICDTSKTQIRERCKQAEESLRSDLKSMTKRFRDAQSDLDSALQAHKSEIIKHYVVEAVISTALLGVITVFIIK